MCGICGIISYSEPVNPDTVKELNKALTHRGPDGEGYYFDNSVGLGMRRLSIIDLNTGWQPLFNEDKTLVLILNGEIYNYIELRAFLSKKGHKFSTLGDGETIIHLYEEFGIKCLDHLRGMFSFILYDINKHFVFVARDRLGEKPLYIAGAGRKIYLCSELKPLINLKKFSTSLNFKALDQFFHYHYIPEPLTPFNEIKKLEPGHYLKIDLLKETVLEEKWWSFLGASPIKGNPGELIRECLEETGKMVIRSDVPVGVALSGGMDSSVVAAIAMKHYGSKMNAFTVGYEGCPESDERNDARDFASYLGMPFHEIELKSSDLVSNFPLICSLTDDPIADISAFSYYSISKKARESGVPVLLQGQGGDELFWGYQWAREAVIHSKQKEKLIKHGPYLAFWNYLQLYLPGKNLKSIKKWIKNAAGFIPSLDNLILHKSFTQEHIPFYEIISKSKSKDIRKLYNDDFKNLIETINPYEFADKKLPWDNIEILYTELLAKSYLLENGIAQGDRLSMANSVELRLPLLDYRLVETVIGLRKENSDFNLPPKQWLKNASIGILPEWVINRKKRGFEPPVKLWIQKILEAYGPLLINGKLVELGLLSKDSALYLSKNPAMPSMVFPQSLNAMVLELWFRSVYE